MNKCKKCGKLFEPYKKKKTQKYCGSTKLKIGCSYLVFKEKNARLAKKSHKKFRDEKRLKRKCKLCEINIGEKEPRCIYCDKCKKKKNNEQNCKKRFNILKKFNFTCQYCGRKAPEVVLHIDHIFPKSKGGRFALDNLTVACKECNVGKSDILLS